MKTKKTFILGSIALLVLLMIVLFGVHSINLASYYSNSSTPNEPIILPSINLVSSPLPNGKLVDTGYHFDFINKIGPKGNSLNDHLIFVSPEGKQIIVPDPIWFLIGSDYDKNPSNDGKSIFVYNIPIDPADENIIFLSTSEKPEKNSNRTNRIYAYNISNQELRELYHEEVGSTILYTAGIDGSRIVLIRDDQHSSPPYCASIWTPYKSMKYEYLELADVKSGLKSYTVPQYKVKEAQTLMQKCLK